MMWTAREAAASDLPFLQTMLAEAAQWRDGGPVHVLKALSDPEIAVYLEGWPRPGDAGVVALGHAGSPIGATWWRSFNEDVHGYGFVAADIPELTIGVSADWRDHGVGTGLLRELLARAESAGLPALSLSVERDNPARRVYERMGFVTADQGPGAITMVRRIR